MLQADTFSSDQALELIRDVKRETPDYFVASLEVWCNS
jgi:hypothetical protein